MLHRVFRQAKQQMDPKEYVQMDTVLFVTMCCIMSRQISLEPPSSEPNLINTPGVSHFHDFLPHNFMRFCSPTIRRFFTGFRRSRCNVKVSVFTRGLFSHYEILPVGFLFFCSVLQRHRYELRDLDFVANDMHSIVLCS